jgi:hypothetical protein
MRPDHGAPDPIDHELDARLRAAFAPPAAASLAEHAARAARPSPRPPGRWWPWLAAAAALAGITLLVLAGPRRGPEGHDGRELGALFVASYRDALAHGFDCSSCCTPDIDLPAVCQATFAARLDLPANPDVELLGCYGGLPTGGCIALLTTAGGTPTCVFVVPRRNDPRIVLPDGCELHLARRVVGELVLYALSPSADTDALERFVAPTP